MWYYIIIGVLLLFGLWIARFNTAYHHDKLLKYHINIKDVRLQKLLIWQSDPFGGHNDNKRAYRGKMTILGLVLYILWFFLLAFSILFLVFGAETSIEPIVLDEIFLISTLNKGAVFLLNAAYISSAFGLWGLSIVRSREVAEYKFLTVLWCGFIITMLGLSVAMVIETVTLFI